MTPTIVVLDANVLASSAFATFGPLQELIWLWESGKIIVLISDHIWNEVLTTYSKPYWANRMPEAVINETIAILARRTHLIRITAHVAGIASHSEDDLVIATAVSGDTEYLVTGDKRLRKVWEYKGVKLRTPQEFLEEFERVKPG